MKGVYSDGVNRNITASASGTTYQSSNEKIVTVSPEGRVTARGLGAAKITVKNGNYSSIVDINLELTVYLSLFLLLYYGMHGKAHGRTKKKSTLDLRGRI